MEYPIEFKIAVFNCGFDLSDRQYVDKLYGLWCEAVQQSVKSQDDGWITWSGDINGEMPALAHGDIKVKYRNSKTEFGTVGEFDWNWGYHMDGNDIVAYKIL